MRTAGLERAIARARSPGGSTFSSASEPCALCASPLGDEHPHMLDTTAGRPVCVCRPCALLFERPVAAGGRYRAIPSRRSAVDGLPPGSLHVPVGLAFFVMADDGSVTAHYPSPGGPTRWEVDAEDWDAAVAACGELAGMKPEVEALLVNRGKGLSEAWIVPVTDCYRLVAVVREHWEGLSGGDRVWKAVEQFFDQMRRSDGTDPGG